MHSFKKFLSFVIITALPTLLFSGTTGKIVGTVHDTKTSEPLIGVNIFITGTSLGATTDLDGSYFILNLPPGTYNLEAQYIGYSTVKIQEVKVNVDLTTKMDFSMQEAVVELAEEIVVVAQRSLVVKDLTATTATIDASEIQALPITEISEALALKAGYVDGHVRGGRSGEVAYWIDGMPVTDMYDGGQVVEVNKDMVEQLQFISGAFNAEYGQAMSGIVNITTKEPSGGKFGGNLSLYLGGHYSSHDNIFYNINNFDPTDIYNVDGGIYGSIIPNKLSYYVNARYIYFDGWYYGKREFNPNNISYTDSAGNYILSRDESGKGDGDYVPMNWNRKLYWQGKLIYNITPMVKLTYSFISDDVNYEDYTADDNKGRNYKLNPDGNLNRFRAGYTHLLKLTQALSNSTFFDIGISYFDKSYKHYVYEDKYDPRYVHPRINELQQLYSFKTGGTDNQYFSRQTKTALLKFDFTSQLDKRHLVKIGLEGRKHNVSLDDITLRPLGGDELNLATDSPYMQPYVPDISSPYHSSYEHNPVELSAYLQDKMEFSDIIVNLGVRIDYFQPDGVILTDPSDPDVYNPIRPQNRYQDLNGNGLEDPGESYTLEQRQAFWYKNAKSKTKASPRLGVSFPVTETGVVHFSYGHFFQIPNFDFLYRNPQFKLGTGTDQNQGLIGNADLRPEQTISGEIGFQQQIASDMVLDMTVYFRDIRDLTGTRAEAIEIFGGSATYSKLINSDFGFVRGIILSFKNRYKFGINYSVDYTFQVAKGTASDVEQARNALIGGDLPEVQLVPLNWDQRHTLNATLSYVADSWGLSFISNLGSGLPYSPRKTEDVSSLRENSQNKPVNWNIDMRLNKEFTLYKQKFSVFLRVFNLLDRLNQLNVYDDTGRADFTTDLKRIEGLNPNLYVNTLEEWFTNETYYSEPRRIEMGLIINF
jgi:outer membrane receptor protein involved in Fe transport